MRWRGGALAAVAAGVLVFAPAALASGPTYCVGEPSCPGESLGEAGNGEQLQAALKKAGETPESTLLIGPGDYSHAGGFKYEGGAVTIRGAGETSTLLSDDGAPGAVVLTVKPAAKAIAAVSRLGAQVPRPIEGKGNEQGGLLLEAGARLEHVDVFGGGGVEDVGCTSTPGRRSPSARSSCPKPKPKAKPTVCSRSAAKSRAASLRVPTGWSLFGRDNSR